MEIEESYIDVPAVSLQRPQEESMTRRNLLIVQYNRSTHLQPGLYLTRHGGHERNVVQKSEICPLKLELSKAREENVPLTRKLEEKKLE